MTVSIDQKCFLARFGKHGQISVFRSDAETNFLRGDRVLCNTDRGLEVAHVLGPTTRTPVESDAAQTIYVIHRRMRPEDELLWGQLQELGDRARDQAEHFAAGSGEQLLEVEPLMDGRTLIFQFVSEPSDSLKAEVDRLVEVYEQTVQQSEFASLVSRGCGPGCGTEEAAGCGTSGGCAVCKVRDACKRSAD